MPMITPHLPNEANIDLLAEKDKWLRNTGYDPGRLLSNQTNEDGTVRFRQYETAAIYCDKKGAFEIHGFSAD
jgi:hypothetical protein